MYVSLKLLNHPNIICQNIKCITTSTTVIQKSLEISPKSATRVVKYLSKIVREVTTLKLSIPVHMSDETQDEGEWYEGNLENVSLLSNTVIMKLVRKIRAVLNEDYPDWNTSIKYENEYIFEVFEGDTSYLKLVINS